MDRNPGSHPEGQVKPASQPFRILSLDGGGIRGAFTASFLAAIEERLGHSVTDHFDLIAGTSTGGIIAVAMAFGERCERIRDFYSARGPEIFTRRPRLPVAKWLTPLMWFADRKLRPYKLDVDCLRQSKYDGIALRAALVEVFGNRTLEDAKKRLIVPAVDLISGNTVVFKTPHQPNSFRDRHSRAVDVVLSTTAAPTYFPHAVMNPGTAYMDGGVWADNPSIAAYVEAIKIREVCTRSGIDPVFSPEDIQILSVGTGRPNYSKTPPEAGAGIGWWSGHLLDVVFTSQAQGVYNQCRYVLGNRYHRIDFDLADSTWGLDSVELIPKLLQIGSEKAAEHYAKLRHELFSYGVTHPYHPFD